MENEKEVIESRKIDPEFIHCVGNETWLKRGYPGENISKGGTTFREWTKTEKKFARERRLQGTNGERKSGKPKFEPETFDSFKTRYSLNPEDCSLIDKLKDYFCSETINRDSYLERMFGPEFKVGDKVTYKESGTRGRDKDGKFTIRKPKDVEWKDFIKDVGGYDNIESIYSDKDFSLWTKELNKREGYKIDNNTSTRVITIVTLP